MEELINLDFTPGIRAEYLNRNFNLIHQWLKRERLRVGGWGLVEGFELSADIPAHVVTVGAGIMINRDGEEVHVPEKSFYAGPLEKLYCEETVTAPKDGILTLKFRPYSESQMGYFGFKDNVSSAYPVSAEIRIEDVLSGLEVPIHQIDGRKCYINAEDWATHELKIEYFTARDRIDTILLRKDGSYEYEKSIVSTSPSHVALGDYDNQYMVGVIYWHIDATTEVEFFTDHRTYRKVYVDEQNRLWLNGKLYHDAQIIYMEQPKDPLTNDLWYDADSNTLMIWRETDGVYGWVIVNDKATIEERQHKLFIPGTKDYPADNKSFRFRDDEVNLHYVPNRLSLDIIVDNAPLMSDQFEEYVPPVGKTDKNYLAVGKGFDLMAPLDRPTVVEAIVHHTVKAKPVRETFQRAAIFIAENHDYYAPSNARKVFETASEYVIGDNQLEVFLDGKRLTRGVEFAEMKDAKADAASADRNRMSRYFRLLCNVKDQQLVTHKISKHVWSFDQLDQMMHDIEKKANDANKGVVQLRTSISNFNMNFTTQLAGLNNRISAVEDQAKKIDECVKKTDMIDAQRIPEDIKDRLVGSLINQTFDATQRIMIADAKPTDYFTVNFISPNINRLLVRSVEYEPVMAGGDIRIDLAPNLRIAGATVYVTGFRIGGR